MQNSLQRLVSQWASDPSLVEANQLRRRMEVLDRLDAYLPAMELQATDSALIDAELYRRARDLRARLEAANAQLYRSIREEIQQGICPARFLDLLPQPSPHAAPLAPPRGIGYDYLDELLSGVLEFDQPAEEPLHARPESVFYQPTPARHIFALMAAAAISSSDVLVDLGSGLGHVALLVSVCTGARSIGVEWEPGYVACARRCAQRFNLSRVSFIEKDARHADFSIGTVFYLYTPFTGSILRAVLDSLRKVAADRPIRVCTFGPCAHPVGREPWLEAITAPETERITVFVPRA